jgi:hypothetical protein
MFAASCRGPTTSLPEGLPMIVRMDAPGMPDLSALQYGRCPCSGLFEPRRVEIRMMLGGQPRVWNDVAQGACPNCGSRVYKLQVLERLEALFSGA